MYSPKAALSCPTDFNFPFTPYNIQQQLMQQLYQVLENKQIGIFESPTGTGKSLTLTCSALKWLEDHEELVKKELQQRLENAQKELLKLEKESQDVLDWITMHSKTSQQRQELLELNELKTLLDEFEIKLSEIKNKHNSLNQTRSKNITVNKVEETNIPDMLDDVNISLEDMSSAENIERVDFSETREKYRNVQIFFCSRTHTQLTQVVRELKRTAYGKLVRCVSLASRQQLCIHKQLRKINNAALINEKCLDMAKETKTNAKPTGCHPDSCVQKKAKVDQNSVLNTMTKCEFKTQTMVQNLTEISLVDMLDIEDLIKEGEKLQACPYYAARHAIQLAQIVMLPYQLLLHKRTRQQSGIDLKGSIVIIDEAHNLLDTISQMHSCELSLQQLQTSHEQILAYKMKYAHRFNASNLLSINQLLFVIKRLTNILKSGTRDTIKSPPFRMICSYELMSEGDFFNIDLYQLLKFCENSRLAQKLQGFAKSLAAQPNLNENNPPTSGKSAAVGLLQRLEKNCAEKHQKSKNKLEELDTNTDIHQTLKDKNFYPMASPIRPLISFFEALCEKADDGRILINIASESAKNYEFQTSFKYILLNPGAHFQDIVSEARAIIVAGGTMQPTAELTEQLFHSCPERVQLRFYDHVVPYDAVLPFVVTKGPSGKNLCFNYSQRSSNDMLSDLCTVLENLCNVVPAGLVCFLPSYDYLDTVYLKLQTSGVLQRISCKKRVFKEPRSITINDNDVGSSLESNQTVEQLLNDYAKAIKHNHGGALLLSVVGAKLSEGLNFTDDLGRGVIVVGMPYPNRNSPELLERMSYLDSTLGAGAGSEYYENLCMKAVNQCIGRSVRHIRDYACVYLLDERYAREYIKRKLPQWISRHLQIATTYGQVQGGTAKFFKKKKV